MNNLNTKNVSGAQLMGVLTATPCSLHYFHPLIPQARYIIPDCEAICKL